MLSVFIFSVINVVKVNHVQQYCDVVLDDVCVAMECWFHFFLHDVLYC